MILAQNYNFYPWAFLGHKPSVRLGGDLSADADANFVYARTKEHVCMTSIVGPVTKTGIPVYIEPKKRYRLKYIRRA